MKRLAGLVLGLIASTAWAQAPVCPMPGDWQFVPEFSDEFNDNKLDDATVSTSSVSFGRQKS